MVSGGIAMCWTRRLCTAAGDVWWGWGLEEKGVWKFFCICVTYEVMPSRANLDLCQERRRPYGGSLHKGVEFDDKKIHATQASLLNHNQKRI